MSLTPLLALLLTQSPTYYSQTEAQSLFSQAAEAYSRGDLAAAQSGFQKLADHGHATSDVLYNLGTAHLAAGELGPAILHLERAHRLAPGADDIAHNLDNARARQVDQVNGQGGGPFLQRFVDATTPTPWAVLFLLCWWVGFGALIARRVWGWAVLVLSVPFAIGLAAHVWVRETHVEAVVMGQTVAARDLPRANAKAAFEVHAGLKVRVLEESEGFVHIRLPNGLEGWAAAEEVARL